MAAIGIDLGTTNSCTAVLTKRGNVMILPSDNDRKTTPSMVAFSEDNILIGSEAKNQIITNPKNTVFGAKRLVGYKFSDDAIQNEIDNWPYEIVPGKNDRAAVKVLYKREKKVFTPEEIQALILRKLKETAQLGLDETITKAVITVPAYFSTTQRQSTIDAGKIAGIEVIGTISEPTAAALAYVYKKKSTRERNIFVFDFGGGTLDCTLMNVKDGKYTVIATAGDTHLGGEDIDMALARYIAKKFKQETKIDIFSDSKYDRQVSLLKQKCEELKIGLSQDTVVERKIELGNFCNNKNLCEKINKGEFECICDDIFANITEPIDSVFEAASEKLGEKINPSTFVDEILLIGGSSHIPWVVQAITDYFEKEPIIGIDPDIAVASGAAIYAAALSGGKCGFNVKENLEAATTPISKDDGLIQFIDEDPIKDVTPLSLGIESYDGKMEVIIKNNTPVPCEETRKFVTPEDYLTSMTITVYEGQRGLANKNRMLGNFEIDGLTKRKKGKTEISVTFKIDKDNTLFVTVKEKGGSASESLKVKDDTGRLTEEDISRMRMDALKYMEADKKRVAVNQKLNELEEILNKANKLTKSPKAKELVNEIKNWVDHNPTPTLPDVNAFCNKCADKLKDIPK